MNTISPLDAKTIGYLFLKKLQTLDVSTPFLGTISGENVDFMTHEEFMHQVEQAALGLKELGLGLQDKISLWASTSKIWHILDLATMSTGRITVPIYPNYIPSEVLYLINHFESKILFLDTLEQFNKILEIQHKFLYLKKIIVNFEITQEERKKLNKNLTAISFTELEELGKQLQKQSPEGYKSMLGQVHSTMMASIIYTSGTTGEPKGAIITHNAFVTMLKNVHQAVGTHINHQDLTLTFLPLAHVFGRADSLLHLTLHWRVVYSRGLDKIIDDLTIVRPSIMLAVPRIFEKVYAKVTSQIQDGSFIKQTLFKWAEKLSSQYFDKLDQDQVPTTQEILGRKIAYKIVFSKIYERFGGKIKFFVSGGAPLAPTIIKFLRNANLTILEGYGLTETVAPCCLNPVHKQIAGTIGVPMGEVQIKLAEDGEILIKSEAMLSEYYKNKEASDEAFKDGWFATGDIGVLTSEGYLKITDRKKDIIITAGGKNVAPQKIENAMKLEPHIAHFLTIGDKRKFLTAIVALEKATWLPYLKELGFQEQVTVEELSKNDAVKKMIEESVEKVNQELSRFETIKKFIIAPYEFSVETGELTASLKLKKKEIMKRFEAEIEQMYTEH